MLVALLIALAVGAGFGAMTMLDLRIRVADDLWLAAVVGASGALAGWALLTQVFSAGDDGFDLADFIGALLGALVLLGLAWLGRRRPLPASPAGDAPDDGQSPPGV